MIWCKTRDATTTTFMELECGTMIICLSSRRIAVQKPNSSNSSIASAWKHAFCNSFICLGCRNHAGKTKRTWLGENVKGWCSYCCQGRSELGGKGKIRGTTNYWRVQLRGEYSFFQVGRRFRAVDSWFYRNFISPETAKLLHFRRISPNSSLECSHHQSSMNLKQVVEKNQRHPWFYQN